MDLRNLAMIKNKTVAVACIAAASVIGASAAGGAFAAEEDTAEAVNDALPVAAETAAEEEEQDSFEYDNMISFKKAGIEEYVMEIVEPEQVIAKTAAKSASPQTANDFTVLMPEDTSVVLDPDKPAQVNVGARSIAGEYYTVYDERTGSHVTLNGHELICRIVNSEIGDSWDREAIKAQAVAAYSYVRFNDACGYIPSVGLKAGYSQKINECVSAVEGVCVYCNGAIIDAVYSASSAGASAASEKIWGAAHPYLKAVVSEFDSKDPNYGVTRTFTKDELKKIIEKNTGIKLSDDPRNWFEIESVFSGKYVDLMKLDGKQYITVNGSRKRVTGALMRSTILGISNLKSTAFEISYKDGVFTFKTYGWGHGVGMSQWGACLYARAGYSYDQILRHYYTNTTVAVSAVNAKAVERAKMTEEQLKAEREKAKINKENEANTAESADKQEVKKEETKTEAVTDTAKEDTKQTQKTDDNKNSEPAVSTPNEAAPAENDAAQNSGDSTPEDGNGTVEGELPDDSDTEGADDTTAETPADSAEEEADAEDLTTGAAADEEV